MEAITKYLPLVLLFGTSAGLLGVFVLIWVFDALIEPNRWILAGEIMMALTTLIYSVIMLRHQIKRKYERD